MENKLFIAVLLMSIFAIGCTRGEDDKLVTTKTERLRLRLDPHITSLMVRSEKAFAQGNFNLAFALIDSVEMFEPELADAPFMRGRIFRRISELELSSVEFQKVLAIDPEYKGARYNLGINAFESGQLRQAIDFYRDEEASNPISIVYLGLAKAYARLGEPDSARMAYELAIEKEPENATAYMWLGQLLEEIGELDEALEYSLKGAQIKPDDPDYEYIIGSLYLRKGDNEKAIDYLKPVAEQLIWHQGAQYNLGQALLRTGKSDQAKFYLARADTAQQLQQAINEAQEAVTANSGNRDAWVNLSQLFWMTGQKDKAIDAYQVAVNIDPTNFALQNNLANMQIDNGQVETGIRRLHAILEVAPAMTEVWLNLGSAYANSGHYEDARRAWLTVLEQDPGNKSAQANLEQLEAIEREKAAVNE